MRRLVAERRDRPPDAPWARVISFDEMWRFDEMWSYLGARRKGKRREVWIWTAVVEEADGQRWVDFEVGDRSETTFLRLYARLPEAQRYRSDHYQVYEWLSPNRHRMRKGSEVNRNEGTHSRLRDRLRRLQRKTEGLHSLGLSETQPNLIPARVENTGVHQPDGWDAVRPLLR